MAFPIGEIVIFAAAVARVGLTGDEQFGAPY